jgi:hypothetical protein
MAVLRGGVAGLAVAFYDRRSNILEEACVIRSNRSALSSGKQIVEINSAGKG